MSGISFYLDKDDAVKLLTDYLVREMGTDFPNLTQKQVEEFTRKAWDLGQDFQVGVGDISPVVNQEALDFFNRLNNVDYGKLFNGKREVFEKSIRSALDGTKTKKEALDALKKTLGADLNDKDLVGRIEDIFRNKVYTSQNFSRAKRMQAVGIGRVEIVATMDAKTSAICRELNGRVFEVSEMGDFVDEFIATPVDENFWDKYRQPTAQDIKNFPAMKSSDILKKLFVKAPPFHFKCRTTIIMALKTVINRITGKGEKTVLQGKVEKPWKENRRNATLNQKREWSLSGLEPAELLNKIAAIQGNSVWNSENLSSQWKTRQADGSAKVFGKTEATYANKALDVVKNFSMMYAYIHENKKTKAQTLKYGFSQTQKSGVRFFAPVNAEKFEVESLFILDRDNYTDSFLRIL
ncbi:hypothetical protein [Leptospira weilii]|uniref:hypothetical protein n=1 Tax=Leptospira weilii TaxID=28184 RepID=UPI0002EC8E49|nr:hypothetical protein [Leptospira weilii]